MHDVASDFNMRGLNVADHPMELRAALEGVFDGPMLRNVNTHRKYWHSGAGIDDENIFDRYEKEKEALGSEAAYIHDETREEVHRLWQKQLETR